MEKGKNRSYVGMFVLLYTFIYFMQSFAMSRYVPYLTQIGYNPVERGMLLSSMAVTTIVFQLLIGFLSDKYHTVKKFMIGAVLAFAVVSYVLFSKESQSLIYYLLIVSLSGGILNLNFGVLDNWVFELGEQTRNKFSSIRLFGSIGWAIGSTLISVVIQHFGYPGVANSILLLALICIGISVLIPDAVKFGHQEGEAKPDVKLKDVVELFRNKKYIVLILALFLLYCMNATNNSIVIDKMIVLNATDQQIGLRWSLMALVEIPTYFFGATLLKKLNAYRLLIISASVFTIQFVLYVLANSATMIVLIGSLQILVGPLLVLVARVLVYEYSADHLKSTGQLVAISLFNGMSSLMMPTLAGTISKKFGMDIAISFGVVLGICALLLAFFLNQMYRKELHKDVQ